MSERPLRTGDKIFLAVLVVIISGLVYFAVQAFEHPAPAVAGLSQKYVITRHGQFVNVALFDRPVSSDEITNELTRRYPQGFEPNGMTTVSNGYTTEMIFFLKPEAKPKP